MMLSLMLASEAVPQAAPRPDPNAPRQAEIITQDCRVHDERGTSYRFRTITDSRWQRFNYLKDGVVATRSGAFLKVVGEKVFSGWKYDGSEYAVEGAAFRNAAGDLLSIEPGIHPQPFWKLRGYQAGVKRAGSHVLYSSISAIIVTKKSNSAVMYTGVCSIEKYESVPGIDGVRGMDQ